MARGLVIVDIQRDYFPGGAHPLEGPEAAAASAARLLADFRAAGDPVFHVRHIWDEEEATFMRPGTDGVEIHESVAPQDGDLGIAVAETTPAGAGHCDERDANGPPGFEQEAG